MHHKIVRQFQYIHSLKENGALSKQKVKSLPKEQISSAFISILVCCFMVAKQKISKLMKSMHLIVRIGVGKNYSILTDLLSLKISISLTLIRTKLDSLSPGERFGCLISLMLNGNSRLLNFQDLYGRKSTFLCLFVQNLSAMLVKDFFL